MSAPERIWASSVTENYGEWQTVTDGMPRPTEYVRADLYAALEAQLAEARSLVAEANNSLYGSHSYFHSTNGGEFDKYHLARPIEELKDRARRLSALEATPPAPKVTEEMVGALERIEADCRSTIERYARNGPSFTSPSGDEYEPTSYVIDKLNELADISRAALKGDRS